MEEKEPCGKLDSMSRLVLGEAVDISRVNGEEEAKTPFA